MNNFTANNKRRLLISLIITTLFFFSLGLWGWFVKPFTARAVDGYNFIVDDNVTMTDTELGKTFTLSSGSYGAAKIYGTNSNDLMVQMSFDDLGKNYQPIIQIYEADDASKMLTIDAYIRPEELDGTTHYVLSATIRIGNTSTGVYLSNNDFYSVGYQQRANTTWRHKNGHLLNDTFATAASGEGVKNSFFAFRYDYADKKLTLKTLACGLPTEQLFLLDYYSGSKLPVEDELLAKLPSKNLVVNFFAAKDNIKTYNVQRVHNWNYTTQSAVKSGDANIIGFNDNDYLSIPRAKNQTWYAFRTGQLTSATSLRDETTINRPSDFNVIKDDIGAVEAEITVPTNYSAEGFILSNRINDAATDGDLCVGVNANGNLFAKYGSTLYIDTTDLRTGEKTAVAVAINKTTGKLEMYINGEKTFSSDTPATTADGSDLFIVGARAINVGYSYSKVMAPFGGEITYLALFSSRSETEIARDYTVGTNYNDDNDVLYAFDMSTYQGRYYNLVTNRMFYDGTVPMIDNSFIYECQVFPVAEYLSNYQNRATALFNYYYELYSITYGEIDAENEYIRPADAPEIEVPQGDYTIAIMPDPQYGVSLDYANAGKTKKFQDLVYWLVGNREKYNIQYSVCVGDIVQQANWVGVNDYSPEGEWYQKTAREYAMAREAFGIMDSVGMPYAFCFGNHDIAGMVQGDPTCTYGYRYINPSTDYFKYDYYRDSDLYDIHSYDGTLNNTYHLFSVTTKAGETIKYLVLNLEFLPTAETVEWANQVCVDHPDYRVIINSHYIINPDGTENILEKTPQTGTRLDGQGNLVWNNGIDLWENLIKRHKNIFMVTCGHQTSDNVLIRKSIGDNGNVISYVQVDSDCCVINGARSFESVCLLTFDEEGGVIGVRYISTTSAFNLNTNNFDNLDPYKPHVHYDLNTTEFYGEAYIKRCNQFSIPFEKPQTDFITVGATAKTESDGLRFTAKISQDYYDRYGLGSDESGYYLGMIIVPEKYLDIYADEIIAANYDIHSVLLDKKMVDIKWDSADTRKRIYEQDGFYYANGVINNLQQSSLQIDFTAIPYIYNENTGAVELYDENFMSNFINRFVSCRSAAYIAGELYADSDGNFKDWCEDVVLKGVLYSQGVSAVRIGSTYTYTYGGVDYGSLESLLAANPALSTDYLNKQLSGKNYALGINEKKQIEISENVLTFIKWTSSDELIASVGSDGRIKGVGVGNCVIKATVLDKTYTFNVSVFETSKKADALDLAGGYYEEKFDEFILYEDFSNKYSSTCNSLTADAGVTFEVNESLKQLEVTYDYGGRQIYFANAYTRGCMLVNGGLPFFSAYTIEFDLQVLRSGTADNIASNLDLFNNGATFVFEKQLPATLISSVTGKLTSINDLHNIYHFSVTYKSDLNLNGCDWSIFINLTMAEGEQVKIAIKNFMVTRADNVPDMYTSMYGYKAGKTIVADNFASPESEFCSQITKADTGVETEFVAYDATLNSSAYRIKFTQPNKRVYLGGTAVNRDLEVGQVYDISFRIYVSHAGVYGGVSNREYLYLIPQDNGIFGTVKLLAVAPAIATDGQVATVTYRLTVRDKAVLLALQETQVFTSGEYAEIYITDFTIVRVDSNVAHSNIRYYSTNAPKVIVYEENGEKKKDLQVTIREVQEQVLFVNDNIISHLTDGTRYKVEFDIMLVSDTSQSASQNLLFIWSNSQPIAIRNVCPNFTVGGGWCHFSYEFDCISANQTKIAFCSNVAIAAGETVVFRIDNIRITNMSEYEEPNVKKIIENSGSYDAQRYMLPVWENPIIYNETAMFVGKDDVAPLLYEAEEVYCVRSYDLKTIYIEGVDYIFENNCIRLTADTRIPYFTLEEYYPTGDKIDPTGNVESLPAGTGALNCSVEGHDLIIYGENNLFQSRQIAITYRAKGNDYLPAPEDNSANFTNVISKLEAKEGINIVFYGDSITTGMSSSAAIGQEPHAAPFYQAISEYLFNRYGYSEIYYYFDYDQDGKEDQSGLTYSGAGLNLPKTAGRINVINSAVGGVNSQWGAENVETRVTSFDPDLTIIAFGMNDVVLSATQHKAQIEIIAANVLTAHPDSSVLLVSTTLPNEECSDFYKQQATFEAVEEATANSDGHIGIAKMTTYHSLLMERKRFYDMTGNNVNHVNDFLGRVYAQVILGSLLGSDFTPLTII